MSPISNRRTYISSFSLGTLLCLCIASAAQTTVDPQVADPMLSRASATTSPEQVTLLPDAPGAAALPAAAASPSDVGTRKAVSASIVYRPDASHTEKLIEPGQIAPRLSVGDTVVLGLRDAVSPAAISGWFASAGYEQLLNGSPNYGTDRGAFGERLGAAAIRDATEGIFSDSVMSPLFREDPRYYRLGPSHNFFVRVLYAGTRPILTRTDGGRTSPNFAVLSGTMAGSALTNLYYPQVNRGPAQTMMTFGGSLGGSAVGDLVGEFYGDMIHLFRPNQH